jgi:hypothetical protein
MLTSGRRGDGSNDSQQSKKRVLLKTKNYTWKLRLRKMFKNSMSFLATLVRNTGSGKKGT